MTHEILKKSESYLLITSIVSIGVLSGNDFLSLVLAVLLIVPVIRFIAQKIFYRGQKFPTSLDKCISCK